MLTNEHRDPTEHDIDLGRINLHYLQWDGTEPTILLLHPTQLNSHIWRNAVAASALPNRFLAPDQRGHGASDYPAEGYTLDEYMKDDLALIDALGLEKVVVVGLATGGNIGLLLASVHPERVAALVVANPGLTLSDEIMDSMQAKVNEQFRFASIAEARKGMFFTELWPDDVLNTYATKAFRTLPDGQVEWRVSQNGVRATYAAVREGIWDRIDVRCPTLLIRGEGARVFTSEDVSRLEKMIPEARGVVIEGTGQLVNQDNPGEFARCLDEFISGLNAGRRQL